MDTLIDEVTAGLLADHAHIAPKYLYDAVGSVLFEAICVLPEYYLTRTEAHILQRFQSEIAHTIPSDCTLIDLGAGNCAKAASLFSVIHPHQYVAVDISVNHLTDAVNRLQQRFPFIEMMALEKDLSHPWDLPPDVRREQRLFFYPGSSIGNFQEDDARTFLKRCRALCDNDGGILIGIDLIKDPTILHEAYNDSLGVTAAFNLNALRHINSLIAADFDVRQWQHEAFFNVDQSRIEMHLQARTDLDVRWKTYHRHFQCGERIHTESSYKYHLPTFLKLLAQSGFEQVRVWTDENAWYAMIYAKAAQ